MELIPPYHQVCSPAVVEQFAKVAHLTDFLYCYPILEANRRSDFGSSSSQSLQRSSDKSHTKHRPKALHPLFGNDSVHRELNTYFPFDPYKLPRSLAYIEGIYREWSSVAIDDDEDEDDDDESDAEEVHEDERLKEGAIAVNGVKVAGVDDAATEGLGASFGGMSISPIGSVLSGVPMSVSFS